MNDREREVVREKVREASDIVEIIGQQIQLKKASNGFFAVCPFHREKTASFHVNPARQSYHCFGCGAGGDVFKFVMQMNNLDFAQALKLLGDRAGIAIEYTREDREREKLYSALEAAATIYQRELRENPGIAAAYIKKKKFDEETLLQFRVGFAPDSFDFLCSRLESRFDVGIYLPKGS